MQYLPSKEFQKKIVIVFSCFLALFLISLLLKSTHNFSQTKKGGEVLVVKDIIEKDTDGDGLKDWEEPLWGFDPKKIDTNGDGRTDFEEVRSAQQALAKENAGSAEKSAVGSTTETGKTALDIVQLISSLYQSGNLTESNVAEVQKKIEEYIKNRPIELRFAERDIQSVSTTKETASAYLKQINTLFGKYPIKEEDFTFVVLGLRDYLDSGKGEESFARFETKYKTLATELAKVPTPAPAVATHLVVINSIYRVGELFADFRAHETDPLRTLAASIEYPSVINSLSTSMSALINLIFNT